MNISRNVLYVGGFELPDKNAAALRVRIIGKLLGEVGFKVSYLGVSRSRLKSKHNMLFSEMRENNLFFVKHPESLFEWITYFFSINKIIESTVSVRPVAIIAYNYPSIALFRLKNYCRKNELALLADCTEWSCYSDKKALKGFKVIDTYIRMKWIHRSLDGLIAISRNLYSFYSPKMENVILLPPLVNKADRKWGLRTTRANNAVLTLVYAGSPGAGNKDRIDILLDSLEKLKCSLKFHLTIIGITKEQCLAFFDIKDTLKKIEERVSFKGRLSHTESLAFIQNSDFFVFFRENTRSTKAGFPTKFVESIACGTPVITNKNSNVEDFLIDGKIGFLLQYNSDNALAASLKAALKTSRIKIEQMKQNCLNTSVFSYQNYVNDFDLFMKAVLPSK